MSSLAKKGLGMPVLKNDRLKNAVKRSNLLKQGKVRIMSFYKPSNQLKKSRES
jgi:hypothetical protein